MLRPVYEEEYDGLLLVEYEEFEVKKPSFLILGLPDTGLVGVISSNHLVEVLSMKEVAGIDLASMMPPVAVISNGIVRPPLRIYVKDNIMALSAETPVPPQAVYPLSKLIVDYALKRGIDYLISIVGIASPNRVNMEKPNVYWIASNEKARKLVENIGIEGFINGYLVGPYALILKNAIRSRVANLVLLADAYIEFPDPEAAAAVLSIVSKITGVSIDVNKLLEQAEMVRLRLRNLMRQTKQAMSEMRTPSPLIYT
ncbi:proteasome assembly chaperone family protein [Hyperthermus butylicus]|uniref:Conserved archaeal protein n=1 Tax=Hyperthermus butylicus (strain DSM 5456 / JCM 9403 / PLM1-5) TaxID=415426 RepID=A2BLR4_HYPBU|nr:PAC2 family protein [Hyperthermus butylicus]ABM80925.1 conserved archaeal protein [Hyperthermus butylicus DSM 5456]